MGGGGWGRVKQKTGSPENLFLQHFLYFLHDTKGFSYGINTVLLNSILHVQYNLISANTDGSFTVDNSYTFLSSYEIPPIAQGKKIFRCIF